MTISSNQENQIIKLLRSKMNHKLKNYVRETTSMPFLTKLVQNEEIVASYSFMISLATTLGMSVYERLAVILAKENSQECDRAVRLGGKISQKRKAVIADIMRDLRNGKEKPDKKKEMKKILSVSNADGYFQREGNIADFYMKRNGQEYYFEIKTVKPNIDVFTKSKEKMLEWVAKRDKEIKSIVALPYNPYAPDPYERFTEQNVLDKKEEFMVGKDFWDFLGGEGTYEELLEIFDKVGKESKSKLQKVLKEAGKKVAKV